ncbi:neprilysin-1-like isoform X3 [Tachypleus tridentatus]|uniref:neprilysin-1-like isoform X3 n=1 Tax=Tachypleus tridentatus TaxID=6853 RepID=UPI003FD1AEF2
MPADVEKGRSELTRASKTRRWRCWGSPKTVLERTLLTMLLVMSTLCAVMVVLLTRSNTSFLLPRAEVATEKEPVCPGICITETCVRAAAELIKNMDPTANPCDDFYQYACGNWHRYHFLPADRPQYNTFSLMKDNLITTLRDLFQEPITEDDNVAIINVKNLYLSCMNESLIEQRRETPLLEFLKIIGDWPAISSSWIEEEFDWIETVANLRLYKADILIAQWVGPDTKNASVHIIQLDQPDLLLPDRDYYIRNTEHLKVYLKFMIDVALLLGAELEIAKHEMEQVLAFEISLANITIPREERINFSAIYSKMTLEELCETVPQVNWTKYFELIMPMEIPLSEEVVVYALGYLKDMGKLVESTSKRVVVNYILWRFIYNRISYLDSRYLEKQQEFFSALSGTPLKPERWKTCTHYVNKYMGMATGALYVKSHFPSDSKKTAEQIIEDIKRAFMDILEEIDWMDNNTKSVAKRKAKLITQKIGYPEFITNNTELDKEYEGIELHPDKYFENGLENLKYYAFQEQLKLRTPVNRNRWVTSPAVVNAFYTRSKNLISFPAGILQPPLYHQNYPRFLNYGGIGVVIGHEVTHGFDNKGRQFDPDGNLQSWWHNDSIVRFQAKAECVINQYSNYVVPDLNIPLNGINTQGENIADNGGVKQAFWAYKRWAQKHGPESSLPGINLNHYQLFFLQFAQIWCGISRPKAAVHIVRVDSHSPGRFRVVGTLSNLKEFSEVYHCPPGSPMNPRKKCEVW